MNDHAFGFHGAALRARGAGTLWWPAAGVLVVADLHLGKAGRLARHGGAMLPPYEAVETLARLEAEIAALDPIRVIALGDSFDDPHAAGALPSEVRARLAALASGRRWTWITGNHDPGPLDLPGDQVAEARVAGLDFRHIAAPGAVGEVSAHYHPKARLGLRGGAVSRPCFLVDADRIVLPAFGSYTGGLETCAPELCALMGADAVAILTGRRALAVPMPRAARRRRFA